MSNTTADDVALELLKIKALECIVFTKLRCKDGRNAIRLSKDSAGAYSDDAVDCLVDELNEAVRPIIDKWDAKHRLDASNLLNLGMKVDPVTYL